MTLYRAFYLWPSGEPRSVTFTAWPRDALLWAASYVRGFRGELLSLTEQRPLILQLKLT